MRIHDIAEDLRPQERLIHLGAETLSNAELLALILRNGTKSSSVLDIAHRIFGSYDLRELALMDHKEIKALHGIGDAKSCQLVACFELARRLAALPQNKRQTVRDARDVAALLLPHLSGQRQEHAIGVYLDARGRIIRKKTLFIGSLDMSVIHPREVFAAALKEGAAAVILVHNHPSGDPRPSEEDIAITGQLQKAGEIVGIEFLDHIIIGDQAHCSLRENGFMD